MSNSRKSKSSSSRHKRSRYSTHERDRYQVSDSEEYSSDSGNERNSRRRSRSRDRSRDHSSRSHTDHYRKYKRSRSPDKDKNRGRRDNSSSSIVMKSQVQAQPSLPSLMSPRSLLPPGISKPQLQPTVVLNKSGLAKKGQAAKSLMDLQFEDRSLVSNSQAIRQQHSVISDVGIPRNKPKKTALLPEPYQIRFQQQPNQFISQDQQRMPINSRNDNRRGNPADSRGGSHFEVEPWPQPLERKKPRQSWKESEVSSLSMSCSHFSSSYQPLVVESDPGVNNESTEATCSETTTSSFSVKEKSNSLGNQRKKSYQLPKSQTDKIVTISTDRKNVVFLIIPSTLPWIHLHGRARIKVIQGTVTILAHKLVPHVGYDVFSPSSNCLLSMQVDPVDHMSVQDVKNILGKIVKDPSPCDSVSEKSIGIIKVERLESSVCDHLMSIPPFTKLFVPKPQHFEWNYNVLGVTLFGGGLRVAPAQEMGVPCMGWDDSFNDALDKWLETVDKGGEGDDSPVFVSCGAKNAGKSMFNRCVVNSSLRCVSGVAYLDCDVGQTEFSPPATMSLHIINKPVLSPPFCHQRHAEKLVFYGDVSPVQDPSTYVRCLQQVFEAYRQLNVGKKLPLIVNTMGFPDGVGLMLLVDTLNLARPNLVVQFESEQVYANISPVTQEMIALDEGWTINKCPPADVKERLSQVKEHALLIVPSLNKVDGNPNTLKFHPADLRNLTMTSALSLGLPLGDSLLNLTPQTVPYCKLALHVCRQKLSGDELLISIDASVVALCEADLSKAKRTDKGGPLIFNDMPICDCIGLGIVRGIDKDKGVLFVTTTLPRDVVRRVNTILKGSLALPDHFILRQQSTSGKAIPYVDYLANATATFGLRARSRMPRLHTKTKNFVK